MPTYDYFKRFLSDYGKLSAANQRRFTRVLREHFVPDLAAGEFRPGLRVKGVQGAPGVYEMTFAPDSRATFSYGAEQQAGEPHIIWRRVGTHDILRRP